MAKKLIGLGSDGKLVLRLPGGKTEPIPTAVPRSRVFLLVDCSSSMSGSKIKQATDGALAFATNAFQKQYSVGLIAFSSYAEVFCRPQNSLDTIADMTQRLTAGGSTNMTAAIEQASAELNNGGGIRAMVIVTDGVPDNQRTALDAARRAKECGIDIIVIGTDDADRAFLEQIASGSELAMKVPRAQLQVTVAHSARLLPAPRFQR